MFELMPYKNPTVRRAKQREATARWRTAHPERNLASIAATNYARKHLRREWEAERTFRFSNTGELFRYVAIFGVSIVSRHELESPTFIFSHGGKRCFENLHSPLPQF